MNPLVLLQSDMQSTIKNGKIIGKDNLSDNNIDIDFKDFLSNLLLEIEKDGKSSILKASNSDKSKNTNKELQKHNVDIKDNLSKKDDIFSLDELLKLVIFLKTNGLKGNFPTDTKKIDTVLNDKKILQDFKNIKDFKDLLKIANKYHIKIKKFEFEQIDAKDSSYKEIEKNVDKIITDAIKVEKNSLKNVSMLSEKILQKKQHKNIVIKQYNNTHQKNNTLLSKIMQKPTQQIQNNTKNKQQISTTVSNDKDDKINIKENVLQSSVKTNDKDDKINIKENVLQSSVKTNDKDDKINIKENVLQSSVKTNDKDIKDTDKPITKKTKYQHFQKNSNNADLKQGDIQNSTTKQHKKIKSTRENEIKRVSSFQRSKTYTKIVNDIKHEVHKKNKHTDISANDTIDIKNNKKITKPSNNISNIDTKLQENISPTKHTFITPNNTKQINIKESLNNFANDLKEQIANYKPPIMRVKMTLSPKDLGEVNVNLVSRGNTLQININSNTNTMALFTQNQTEFKNALVNMGFTNLNMNFNANQNNKNNQQNSQRKREEELEVVETLENENNENQTVTITMPQYI